MNTEYIYPYARIKALEPSLLTENQVERLLSAGNMIELYKVLQDTFLALRLTERDTDIMEALDQELKETKRLIASLSPEPELTEVLWLRYDLLNLKRIIKGIRGGMNDEDILEICSYSGLYAPETLLSAFRDGTLAKLHSAFVRPAERADEKYSLRDIDIAADTAYLTTALSLAKRLRYDFVEKLITLRTDLFNILSALRAHALDENVGDIFISGASIRNAEVLRTPEEAYAALLRTGGEKHWADAIRQHQENGEIAPIEKAADDLVLAFLREAARKFASPAALFHYFETKKRHLDLIRTVTVAKEAGLNEAELRKMIRKI